MRLGQLARKYDIPVQEIISYLEEQTGEKFHPNAKLFDSIESQVFDHFDLHPETEPEVVEDVVEVETLEEVENPEESVEEVSDELEIEPAKPVPATPEEEIALLDGDLADPNDAPHRPTFSDEGEVESAAELEAIAEKDEPGEDEIIQTDKLLEMLESEEIPADLDKIKLIKAPKRELSGLKVLGKVDLPEPKKKEEKPKEIVTEKDLREYRNPRRKRQPLTEEEKEKRRLKAKQKKEAYEARQEKRQKEQEDKKLKALKEQHYKRKLAQAKAVQVKRSAKHQDPPAPKSKVDTRPKPKTLLGKFWRWMNT